MHRILERLDTKLYLNPIFFLQTQKSQRSGIARSKTLFESDSDFEEDEDLKRELLQMMHDDLDGLSHSEASSFFK